MSGKGSCRLAGRRDHDEDIGEASRRFNRGGLDASSCSGRLPCPAQMGSRTGALFVTTRFRCADGAIDQSIPPRSSGPFRCDGAHRCAYRPARAHPGMAFLSAGENVFSGQRASTCVSISFMASIGPAFQDSRPIAALGQDQKVPRRQRGHRFLQVCNVLDRVLPVVAPIINDGGQTAVNVVGQHLSRRARMLWPPTPSLKTARSGVNDFPTFTTSAFVPARTQVPDFRHAAARGQCGAIAANGGDG